MFRFLLLISLFQLICCGSQDSEDQRVVNPELLDTSWTQPEKDGSFTITSHKISSYDGCNRGGGGSVDFYQDGSIEWEGVIGPWTEMACTIENEDGEMVFASSNPIDFPSLDWKTYSLTDGSLEITDSVGQLRTYIPSK